MIGSYSTAIADGLAQIYMVSSINHHLSILRVLVPPAYLLYLATGTASPSHPGPNSPPPAGLELRRSRWYDLLDAGDRAEAMRGVWGLMAYLMRET